MERLRRGEFAELDDLRAVRDLLITSRIAQGISQREARAQARCA